MKLQCQVEVINRLRAGLNTQNVRRPVKSTVVIGSEPKNPKEHFILHFSSNNKTGARYKVKNIKRVFTKFLNEGRTTLRFEEPPHDLCIKGEIIQLKCFLKLLQSCLTGDFVQNKFTDLSNVSVTSRNHVPTKLVITDRGSYPTKGLPRTLESLHINGIRLYRFPREILRIQHLSSLDLSNNEIENLPDEIGNMTLRELYLAKNKLGLQYEYTWKWMSGKKITSSLKLLDLTNNGMKLLPTTIFKLQQLVTLRLGNNMFESLPVSIGRLKYLRHLIISQNRLKSLPSSLLQLKLDELDLSAQNVDWNENRQQTIDQRIKSDGRYSPWDMYVGSLLNMCAKTILTHKLYYDTSVLPRILVDFLDDVKICICGKPVASDYCVKRHYNLKAYFNLIVSDSSIHPGCAFLFDCYFCSKKCFNRHV